MRPYEPVMSFHDSWKNEIDRDWQTEWSHRMSAWEVALINRLDQSWKVSGSVEGFLEPVKSSSSRCKAFGLDGGRYNFCGVTPPGQRLADSCGSSKDRCLKEGRPRVDVQERRISTYAQRAGERQEGGKYDGGRRYHFFFSGNWVILYCSVRQGSLWPFHTVAYFHVLNSRFRQYSQACVVMLPLFAIIIFFILVIN